MSNSLREMNASGKGAKHMASFFAQKNACVNAAIPLFLEVQDEKMQKT